MTDYNKTEDREEVAIPQEANRDPVRMWTFILMGFVLILLAWYLRADRVTPYTSQARLHAKVVPIAPEVSGLITSVEVENNQFVKEGQELFKIEKHNYELALQIAEAQFDSAQQAAAASATAVNAAQAALDAVKSNLVLAKQEIERMRKIREDDVEAMSLHRLELAESTLTSAAAAVTATEVTVRQALEACGASGERSFGILQAQANLEHARQDLKKTTVHAPSKGVVTGVQLEKGKFAVAGSPQLTFVGTENYWVQAEFTENNLGHIKPGSEVEMVFDVFPGEIYKGTVREMGYGVSVDTTPLGTLPTIPNNRGWLRDTQRFPVLIDFKIMEGPKEMLKVGSQVTVVIYTGDHLLSNLLAKLYIRLASIFAYAY